MILESFKYMRYEGKPDEWSIEDKNGNQTDFQNINLFVGKNAVGKSRSLAAICDIARLLSMKKDVSELKFPDMKYRLKLREETTIYEYFIEVVNRQIIDESLSVDGIEKVNRKSKTIFSEKHKKNEALDLASNTPITSLHTNTDYPYIDEIFEWSNALRNYTFTNQFEKNTLLKSEEKADSELLKQGLIPDHIAAIFAKGKHEFGDSFVDTIINDMKCIHYPINDVDLLQHKKGTGISVQEEELSSPTIQLDMSQGMFRALAFFIQLNYALQSKMSICFLIDDLGEGLDFDRSKSLIDIFIHKIVDSNIQIFITTNDRYIMNKIPLKYWSVIERLPKSASFYNYANSKEIFEDFKFTGLNNFDFLATDFYLHGFEDQKEQ